MTSDWASNSHLSSHPAARSGDYTPGPCWGGASGPRAGRAGWCCSTTSRRKHLDRFGLLLLLTYATIVSFALVNYGSAVSPNAGVMVQAMVSNILASATLWLAMRSAGLARLAARHRHVLGDPTRLPSAAGVRSWFASRAEAHQVEQPQHSLIGLPWVALLLTLCAFLMVLRRLLQHDQLPGHTLGSRRRLPAHPADLRPRLPGRERAGHRSRSSAGPCLRRTS